MMVYEGYPDTATLCQLESALTAFVVFLGTLVVVLGVAWWCRP